jgi:hypothetical protein
LLSDFFGSDRKARAMSEVFEQHVVAMLPMFSWTLTDYALTTALAPLVGLDGARADDIEPDDNTGSAFGDMPVTDAELVQVLKEEDPCAEVPHRTAEALVGSEVQIPLLSQHNSRFSASIRAVRRTRRNGINSDVPKRCSDEIDRTNFRPSNRSDKTPDELFIKAIVDSAILGHVLC